MRMVAVGQSLISDGDCAACAFRNVLASHFSMDAASKTALGAVHSEETAHFGQNAIEGARLVAIASLDDIAMHRVAGPDDRMARSEEHTSELQSLMRISYAVFCLKKKNNHN